MNILLQWLQGASTSTHTSCVDRQKTKRGPKKLIEKIHDTYEFRVRMDPAYCHEILVDLSLKKLNLIRHTALILLSCLVGHNQGSDDKFVILLFSRKNSQSLDFSARVMI